MILPAHTFTIERIMDALPFPFFEQCLDGLAQVGSVLDLRVTEALAEKVGLLQAGELLVVILGLILEREK
eukprot:3982375-Pyramimonas_sp.AAC.1